MGEGFGVWSMGADAELMPYIDMANIACGFHASDPQIMSRTVALAVEHQVSIGAHPSYPDLLGFGRRKMSLSATEIENIILYQVGALQAICIAQGASLAYVKPHGALYNTMMEDEIVYTAVLSAMRALKLDVPLMVMANQNSELFMEKAQAFNVRLLFEAFCDRAYNDSGHLQSRAQEGAVYDCVERIHQQAKQLITQQSVTTVSGRVLNIQADTLCIHGDSPLAVDAVKSIRSLL